MVLSQLQRPAVLHLHQEMAAQPQHPQPLLLQQQAPQLSHSPQVGNLYFYAQTIRRKTNKFLCLKMLFCVIVVVSIFSCFVCLVVLVFFFFFFQMHVNGPLDAGTTLGNQKKLVSQKVVSHIYQQMAPYS